MNFNFNIKQINKNKIKKSTETFFNISITRIQQIFSVNPKGLNKLIEEGIPFDIFLICCRNPYEIDNFVYPKKINKYLFIKDIVYCFYYDFKNFLEIIKKSYNKKKLIISSKRWVKNADVYEKEIRNIFKSDFCNDTRFVYLTDKKPKALNQYFIKIREGLYQPYLDSFEELSEKYTLLMKKKYKNKFIDFKKKKYLEDIKTLIINNQKINMTLNLPNKLLVIIFKILYKFLNLFLLTYTKNKEIYIINTNLWTVGNMLIDQLMFNKEVSMIGCQHGGGYGERERFNIDIEIYCPSFLDFIGFGLFKKNINPSSILNLNNSFQKGHICYVCGPSFISNKELFFQNECFGLIDNLAKNYSCSIRVHPKDNFKKIYDIFFKKSKNIDKINIFKANSKFESISIDAKICIFDYPHSTLFWDAKSKGLNTILIFDLKKSKSISKDLLKKYDLIVDPSNYNWEKQILKFINSKILN